MMKSKIDEFDENCNMNDKKIGMSWLKFFCFIRPFLSFFSSVKVMLDIANYSEYRVYYFGSVWGWITYLLIIIGMIIYPILFFKSKNKDSNTVDFIYVVLLYEVIALSYDLAISAGSVGKYVCYFIFLLIIMYFVWFRTNKKYFERRRFYFDDKDNGKKNTFEKNFFSNKEFSKKSVVYPGHKSRNEIRIDKLNSKKAYFKCDNCGTFVKETAIKCHGCGEEFDEEVEVNEKKVRKRIDMEQKYSDLIKLKELLDNKIISQEEFENEKKKILNND